MSMTIEPSVINTHAYLPSGEVSLLKIPMVGEWEGTQKHGKIAKGPLGVGCPLLSSEELEPCKGITLSQENFMEVESFTWPLHTLLPRVRLGDDTPSGHEPKKIDVELSRYYISPESECLGGKEGLLLKLPKILFGIDVWSLAVTLDPKEGFYKQCFSQLGSSDVTDGRSSLQIAKFAMQYIARSFHADSMGRIFLDKDLDEYHPVHRVYHAVQNDIALLDAGEHPISELQAQHTSSKAEL